MAGGTRGQQDLSKMRELIGPSCKLTETELPTLRDILADLMYEKEMTSSAVHLTTNRSLSKTLAEKIVVIYGANLIGVESLAKKIVKEWSEAVDITNNQGKKLRM